MPEKPHPQATHSLHEGVANLSASPKSNSFPRNSEYNTIMRTRRPAILARFSSLLLTLCLLGVPFCTTRCTLASCFQANASQQSTSGCHHQSANSRGNSNLAATPAAPCLPADSLFTALPAPQSRLPNPISDHDASRLFVSLFTPAETRILESLMPRISPSDSSPGDSGPLFLITPLRL